MCKKKKRERRKKSKETERQQQLSVLEGVELSAFCSGRVFHGNVSPPLLEKRMGGPQG
jgi:hypothetical protein